MYVDFKLSIFNKYMHIYKNELMIWSQNNYPNNWIIFWLIDLGT